VHIAANQLGNRPKLEAIFRRIAESIHQFPLIWCQRKQMCTCLKPVRSLQRCTKIGIFCLPSFPVPSKHQKPGSEWGNLAWLQNLMEPVLVMQNPGRVIDKVLAKSKSSQTLPHPLHQVPCCSPAAPVPPKCISTPALKTSRQAEMDLLSACQSHKL